MKSFDDLVRLLDNATQYSYELDMETLGDPALCWRCDGAPGDGPNGLCGPCGDVLRSDKPVSSPPPLMPPVEVWYIDEVVVAGHAAIYRRRPS